MTISKSVSSNKRSRQDDFVKHYISNGGDATAAALKCGFAKTTAHITAAQYLKDIYVISKIDEFKKIIKKNLCIDKNDILQELWKISTSCESDNKDKISAMREINKMLGFLSDTNVNINQTVSNRTSPAVFILPSNPAQSLTWQGKIDSLIEIAQERKLLFDDSKVIDSTLAD